MIFIQWLGGGVSWWCDYVKFKVECLDIHSGGNMIFSLPMFCWKISESWVIFSSCWKVYCLWNSIFTQISWGLFQTTAWLSSVCLLLYVIRWFSRQGNSANFHKILNTNSHSLSYKHLFNAYDYYHRTINQEIVTRQQHSI